MLLRELVAEGLGSALPLATVVGSGIMGEKLAGGNVAIALLANTLATGAGLVAEPALFFASRHERSGMAQLVSEFVATFGPLSVLWGWLVPSLPAVAERVIAREPVPEPEAREEVA